MEKITTATGKTFDCDYFNPCPATQQCNLRVLNTNLVDVATIFSDCEETEKMWHDGAYASGYTRLVAIVPESDAIRIVLGRV